MPRDPRYQKENGPGTGRVIARACLITLLAVVCLVGGWALGSVKPLPVVVDLVNGGESSSAAQSSQAQPSSEPEASSQAAPSSPVSSEPEEPKAPGIPDDEGIFSAYYERAYEKAKSMTTADLVGQVFIFRCPTEGAVKLIDDCQPGGYCLMADFFEGKTKETVPETLSSFQNSSRTPMFFCCDEEGGTVVRISRFSQYASQKFESPQQVYARAQLDSVVIDTRDKAQLLKSLGLNLNLAPVADISTNPSDFIYDRSLGQDAQTTADYIRVCVETYLENGLACTLKHFPGYGNNGDTHTGLVYDKRPMETFETSDFLPFRAGIEAGAQFVLVSHNVVECMDPDAPASLSPKVNEILRDELGFTGLVMTDDLIMDAITDFTGGKSPAVTAFLAGNDILLSSDPRTDYQALLSAVESGEVPQDRLMESVVRILAAKYAMGLL